MEKRPITDLINHMKKYKDAVIIIGEKVAPELEIKPITEEDGEIFNRKTWVKEPLDFWEHYKKHIHKKDLDKISTPKVYSAIEALELKDLTSKIISTNTHGIYKDALNLKGISNDIKCNKCGKVYKYEEVISNILQDDDFSVPIQSCKNCNGKLRPACLLYGENYHPANVKELREAIFLEREGQSTLANTHTLVLVGVDMTEDLIAEVYDNYNFVIKPKMLEEKNEECLVVMVTDDRINFKLFNPDFGTFENIDDSIERLVSLFD